jgi:hypothetical protein
MFEDDNEGYGLNSYNAHSEDPQCTNALNTEISTNLRTLSKNSAKKVAKCSIQKLPEEIP